ncbi:B-cell CLL/lymphoma 9-like protein [Plectropomus leopardus]|uniref:B-cell CLL/lymphoma 9-like protein n=1 Tax=Plectropomus leopardus TaxID=160734 RepID=UPI001C4BDD38|nr:B-cell CLL/lymphoma 9-like protein [Plectropomus leopardus]
MHSASSHVARLSHPLHNKLTSNIDPSQFRSPSHGGNLNRSASLSCTERAPESGSVGGSITQIPGTPFQYIPDFCVRALTDLQFVKITRAQYQNGVLASRLDSTPQSPEGSHTRLDTSVSLPPVTPPGTRVPLPLATPPVKRPPSNAQPPPSSRAALPQTTSSSSRRPSQCLPQATPPPSNHTPFTQPPPGSMGTTASTFKTHPTLPSSKQSPPSAGPENGPGEAAALLIEQQNCVGPRRPSNTQAPPHPQTELFLELHLDVKSRPNRIFSCYTALADAKRRTDVRTPLWKVGLLFLFISTQLLNVKAHKCGFTWWHEDKIIQSDECFII